MKMEFNKQAKKDFDKLDNSIKKQIYKKLRYIESLENPRDDGKALKGNLFNFWRYRSGDYRIITQILDDKLIILIIKIANRKDAYK